LRAKFREYITIYFLIERKEGLILIVHFTCLLAFFCTTVVPASAVMPGLAGSHFGRIETSSKVSNPLPPAFNQSRDLISLHYDHAPDKDDGQSAAADRTILESFYGTDWIKAHVVAVSGAYGQNAAKFNPNSDAVMDAAWNDCGGWLAAHTDRKRVVAELTSRWIDVLKNGGNIWVKEGGQSDITADVVKRIKKQLPDIDSAKRIYVVQHSNWNEKYTTDSALAYTKKHTHYIKIRDANAYLNIKGGNASFEKAASEHPVFGTIWKTAFDYYDPRIRLDFSDTGELMYILGIGEIDIEGFKKRFLSEKNASNPITKNRQVFPGKKWENATPESQGVDSVLLANAIDFLESLPGEDGSTELVIVRNGYVIWQGSNVNNKHGVWSVTKSFVSTLVGILIDDRRLSLETLAKDIDSHLSLRYPTATIRHFLTMTSGYRAIGDDPRGDYVHGPSPTPFNPDVPLFTPPGSMYAYWDSAVNELGFLITKIAEKSMKALFQERIGSVIDLDPNAWNWGDFGQVEGLTINGGAGNNRNHVIISAIDLARFGHFILNRGYWNGTQLVNPNWIDASTDVQVPVDMPWAGIGSAGLDGRGTYGYLWWENGVQVNGKLKWPGATSGTFAASGYNNNKLFVIPEWNMVIVRLGLDGGEATTIQDSEWGQFLNLVGRAVS
jgi:CubicO group peptidase (beta-lactamase class C family)